METPQQRWQAYRAFQAEQQSRSDPYHQARRYLSKVPRTAGVERLRSLAVVLVHGFSLSSQEAIRLLEDWSPGVPGDQVEALVDWARDQDYCGEPGDKLR